LVPKILVADDNSNIQKMVGLALKDQGIEVVAVGNGEAAVRKISDIRPDLVLADVFMPVRNGYEVCEYVKTDSTLSHIPVILLVGAFDPLDEQEAQRVGADGVLKKPFVPPDPLISMVKSALARAGVLAAAAAKASEPAPATALASVPVEPLLREAPVAALDSESFVDEVPGRLEPVKIDAGSPPVAFGSLLDTATQTTEDDPAFMAQVHPELATERDWRAPDTEDNSEEEEDETASGSWRREETETLADAESAGPHKRWRSGGFEPVLSGTTQAESWEPAKEKPEPPELTGRRQESPAAGAANHEGKPDLPPAPFASEAWAAVIAEKKSAEDTVTSLDEVLGTASPELISPESTASNVGNLSGPEQKSSLNSWFSSAPSAWDSEIQKANRLVSAWDSGAAAPASADSEDGAEAVARPAGEPLVANESVQAVIEEAALPAAAVEAIREEAAQVAEDVAQSQAQPAFGGTVADAPARASEAATPSIDDLVAKVLANLSPDVLQAVTREILKPVVAAMVKEEMKSKKS
jgi:CheY-like chemotaxis protein